MNNSAIQQPSDLYVRGLLLCILRLPPELTCIAVSSLAGTLVFTKSASGPGVSRHIPAQLYDKDFVRPKPSTDALTVPHNSAPTDESKMTD